MMYLILNSLLFIWEEEKFSMFSQNHKKNSGNQSKKMYTQKCQNTRG